MIIAGLVGITLITSMGGVFRPIKQKIKNPTLLEFSMCSQCQGFWIGFIAYIILYFDPMSLMFWGSAILFGGMISLISLVITKIIS